MKKRGISPVIGTILLVSLVMVLAAIVAFWSRGFLIKEVVLYDGKNAEIVCEELSFASTYSGTLVTVSNNGNIPLDKFQIKKINSNGDYSITEVDSDSEIRAGGSGNFILSESLDSYSEILVIPILTGETNGAEADYVCEERHGVDSYQK